MNPTLIKPKVAAFEVTGRCVLQCRHCRAAAVEHGTDPLDTTACKAILRKVADYTRCLLIFTGGEPMMREDIFDLVAYSRSLGQRPVMATCGAGLDRQTMLELKKRGLLSFSFSLDGADSLAHDSFRQHERAFALVMQAVQAANDAGIRFQINTTLTRLNVDSLESIAALAVSLGATCWNPFVLVPVGRGDAIRQLLLEPQEYERVLERLADLKATLPIEMRLTCGPQFARVARQRHLPKAEKVGGCLAATEFVFISRKGDVQTCGFLELSAGNLVKENYTFGHIWERSPLLCGLRDLSRYEGACGRCEYVKLCRGCRARALSASGSVYGEDPICLRAQQKKEGR
jgi:radical SAM protein with 4Fe4S-binding SPASM domain